MPVVQAIIEVASLVKEADNITKDNQLNKAQAGASAASLAQSMQDACVQRTYGGDQTTRKCFKKFKKGMFDGGAKDFAAHSLASYAEEHGLDADALESQCLEGAPPAGFRFVDPNDLGDDEDALFPEYYLVSTKSSGAGAGAGTKLPKNTNTAVNMRENIGLMMKGLTARLGGEEKNKMAEIELEMEKEKNRALERKQELELQRRKESRDEKMWELFMANYKHN